jgi:glyoxylase-like metal-dependent hydrolase (beta-lactamase superfamily II)
MGRFTAVIAASLGLAVSFPAWTQDAAAVLRRASSAMGADELKTLRYDGSGTGASFGQAFKPDTRWPRLTISRFSREIDYSAAAMIEDVTRARAEKQGGGAVPIAGEGRAVGAVSGQYAWNGQGPQATPRQAAREQRLHDLWITPHGILKAAQRNGATVKWVEPNSRIEGNGGDLAAVSFTEKGVMSATAFINGDYLVERVESRVPDPVMGDTTVLTQYSDYRDFGRVKFPTRIRQTMAGAPVLDIEVKEVQPNAEVAIAVPESVRASKENVTAEKAAEGVWFLAGGSHNSVAIEMKDYVILVEAPLYDGRALAVISEVRKLVPGKPLRYVVNSHHHFDHSGGLRAAVGEGAAIIAEKQSKPWYEKSFANPNRIAPDHLAKSRRKVSVVPVNEKLALDDGARKVEVHRIRPSDHVDTFLMVYLPNEKLLVQADAFTPGPPGSPPPAPPNNYNQLTLVENLERLKLQVDRHLPLHGRMVPNAELYRAAGK